MMLQIGKECWVNSTAIVVFEKEFANKHYILRLSDEKIYYIDDEFVEGVRKQLSERS